MKLRQFLLSILLVLLLFGCAKETQEENKDFTRFSEELFKEQVSSDPITLNYSLSHPEKYKISAGPTSLGTVSLPQAEGEIAYHENLISKLQSFSADKLTNSQRILRDNLLRSSIHSKKEEPFLLFRSYLSPSCGIQAQLPVLLCEYRFRNQASIDVYLAMLKSIGPYFKSIEQWEALQKDKGYFMSESTCRDVIAQCNEFTKNPEANLLIHHFEKEISGLSFLTNASKRKYKNLNRVYVNKYVLPAYASLSKTLAELSCDATVRKGLCSYKNGKQYYAWLTSATTGSTKSIVVLKELLAKSLADSTTFLTKAAATDPTAYEKAMNDNYAAGSPSLILKQLKSNISKDFPRASKVNCEVKYVDSSLEDYLSPAFYLTPPIDDAKDNVIYINGSSQYENTNLYTPLAHEGYPGHLYQAVFFQKAQISPLQGMLEYGGYMEGWATYAELYSLKYLNASQLAKDLMYHSTKSSLALYGLCDIGIHYDGWDLKNCFRFLESYGVKDVKQVLELYENIVAEPATYLKYAIGHQEILLLRDKAKSIWGRKYTDKAFHTWFLSIGPCWFSIMEENFPKSPESLSP